MQKNGTETAGRYYVNNIDLNMARDEFAELEIDIDSLPLSVGDYSVTLLVACGNYIYRPNSTFYAVNKDVYYCRRDLYEFAVRSDNVVAQGTPFIGKAEWLVNSYTKEPEINV